MKTCKIPEERTEDAEGQSARSVPQALAVKEAAEAAVEAVEAVAYFLLL